MGKPINWEVVEIRSRPRATSWRVTLSTGRRFRVVYVWPLRQQRNRKYVRYRSRQRRVETWPQATCTENNGNVWTSGFLDVLADKHTDRHADRNT